MEPLLQVVPITLLLIGLLWVNYWSASDTKRQPQKNDEVGWLTFDFWWLLSLALTRPCHGSLGLLMWPRIRFWSSANAPWAPADSNQAKKRASTWTRSNYPPFRTTGCTTGEPTTREARQRGQHWSNPCNALEVHAAHFHIGT